MTDPLDPDTEAKIRRALRARAEETTMSPNALDSIRGPRSPRWARIGAYGAVAALVVLIAGLALVSLPDDDADGVDSADTTLPPDTSVTTTSTPPSSSTSTPIEPGDPAELRTFYGPVMFEERGDDAWVAGPLASSGRLVREGLAYWPTDDRTFTDPDSLSLAYLEEVHGITDPLQIDDVGFELALPEAATDDDRAAAIGFQRTTESGEPFGMGMLIGAAADASGDWHIGQVVSDRLWIDAVEASAASQGVLRIRGGGEAFEGSAVLTVDDGDPVIVSVGAFGPETFSVLVPYDGRDLVRVTLQATDPIDDALPDVVGGWATVEAVDGPLTPPPATYSVFGVVEDDTLNVRAGAGVDNDVVTTLAPDATGILLTGAEELVGSARWVEVETEGGRGWVHSRFLVANADVAATPGLAALLDDQLRRLQTLDPSLFDDVVDVGGIGVYADWPTPWTAVEPDEFGLERNWSPEGTEDRCPGCTATVEEFLGFDTAKWELAEYEAPGPTLDDANPGVFFEHGQTEEFFARYLTGSIHIPEPDPDTSLDWRRYTVVFDLDGESPVIRGVWRWGWTP